MCGQASVGLEYMKNTLAILLIAAIASAGACQATDAPDATTEIRVEPALEQNLFSFSRVVLKDVTVSPGVLEQQYPGARIGQPCLIVRGDVRNMDTDNSTLAIFAYGYNPAGEQVAGTLDAEGVPGQVTVHLEYGQTGQFTLHLNASDEIETVRIFAFTHAGTLS